MKIIFVVTGLGVGGAEHQVVTLADKMAEKGHDVSLCYITGEAKILPNHKTVQVIALNAKKNPWSLTYALIKLRKIICNIQPDIIHSHMVHANLMARIVRLFLNFKTVLICTAHNKNEGNKLRMFAYRVTDSLADLSTNVSQEAVDAFIALKATKPKRMVTVYNGIDTNKFIFNAEDRAKIRQEWQVANDTKILIAIGRLAEAKDYPNLLTAYAKLKQPNTLLWVVGGGSDGDKANLQELAVKLKITKSIHFLGIRYDIPALLSAADIFILSSQWEGLPLVVAEAMACERLVVATNSGGVQEILGDNGYLVPSKDDEALASAMSNAIQISNNEAIELGEKARQRIITHYNIDQKVEQWLKLYQNLQQHKQIN